MPKYTVYFLTPYATWDGVEAIDEDEAINKCSVPPEFDANEVSQFVAIEEHYD